MSFIVIIPVAACIAYFTERRIEETLSISIIGSILILIAAGLLKSFTAGCICILGINAFAALFCLTKLIRDRKRASACILTCGLTAYLIFGILMFVICYRRYLQASDEFTYWAPMAKFYYMNDRFGSASEQVNRYLEISAVWDFFSTKLWPRFSTGMMTLGHAMMILGFLMPVFSEFGKKPADRKNRISELGKWLAVMGMIWMFPMLGAGQFHGYVTLYADMLLGASMCYTLVMFLRFEEQRDRFHYFCMLLGIATIVMTKQAGTVLGAILVLIIGGTQLAAHPEEKRGTWMRYMAGTVAAFLAGALVSNGVAALLGGGGAYTGLVAKLAQHGIILTGAALIVILWLLLFWKSGNRLLLTVPIVSCYIAAILLYMVKGTDLSRDQGQMVLYAVLKTVMSSGSSHMGHWLPLSDYAVVNLLCLLGLGAETLICHKKAAKKLIPGLCRVTVLMAAVCVVLNCLYESEEYNVWTFVATALLVLTEVAFMIYYLQCRRKEETWPQRMPLGVWMFWYLGIGLVMYVLFYYSGIMTAYGEPVPGVSSNNARSLWRYLFSYMGPMVFMMLYMLLRKPKEKFAGNWNPFWTIAMLILLDTDLAFGISQIYVKPQEYEFKGIDGITFEQSDIVEFIDSNEENEPGVRGDFYLQIYPGSGNFTELSNNWYQDEKLYGVRMTPSDVSDMLLEEGCSYVYLRNADFEKGFAAYYAELFKDPDSISYDRLYCVEEDENGRVSLEYVPRNMDREN